MNHPLDFQVNKTLLELNLGYNDIEDEGVVPIADALKVLLLHLRNDTHVYVTCVCAYRYVYVCVRTHAGG